MDKETLLQHLRTLNYAATKIAWSDRGWKTGEKRQCVAVRKFVKALGFNPKDFTDEDIKKAVW